MTTEHSFRIEDAKKYGIGCAVILNNMRYWLDKNRANNKHIFQGRVWTYNSTRAFADLFPYLSEKQIYRRLKKLEDKGVLITGNFNEKGYDQTKWYSVNEAEYVLDDTSEPFSETGESIPRNGKLHSPKSENGYSENGKPIPDINTDSKTDINTDTPEPDESASMKEARGIAEDLLDAICTWDETHKYNARKPSIESWVKDLEKAIRIDKRTPEQLTWMISYLFRAKRESVNSFWAPNIQSGKKLRDKFDTIKNQIIRERKTKGNGRTFEGAQQKHRETQEFLDRYYTESEQ
jgi:hypothetical protein